MYICLTLMGSPYQKDCLVYLCMLLTFNFHGYVEMSEKETVLGAHIPLI